MDWGMKRNKQWKDSENVREKRVFSGGRLEEVMNRLRSKMQLRKPSDAAQSPTNTFVHLRHTVDRHIPGTWLEVPSTSHRSPTKRATST